MRKKEIQTETRNHDLRLREEAVNRGTFEAHTATNDFTERKQAPEKLSPIMEIFRKAMGGGTLQVISDTVETKAPYTADHQRRTADLARAIGREMGLAEDQQEGLLMAGIIHDLGLVSIPAKILNKPAKLSEVEFKLIQTHSQTGHDILKDLDFPWPLAKIVLQHHERLNGSGYPQGLKGEDVSPEAQILMVADVVEAMASYRPYRPALGIGVALEEIKKNMGIKYQPEVVKKCLTLFKEKGFGFK
jgi:HD-GYP domain-containing protein (c-di-GMP phosphodiesterase class II)